MDDLLGRPTVSRAVWLRTATLAGALAVITSLRYATESTSLLHELSLRLYYLPILVGAYWYGPAGGLVTAFIASLVYVPHLRPGGPVFDASRDAEVVVFHVIGLSVGLLAGAQRRVTARFQRAAATLETANQQLRESHEQIRRIDRLKTLGEVAAGLAHEIRHPLASISGALEIIQGRARTDSPEAEFSRLALAEVRRLDKLVWEFLRYARPHAPELRLMPLHEVVAQVSMLLGAEAERAGVALDVEQCDAQIQVSVDPLQIQQVLLNVVLNAIQATPAGGRILIREHVAHGAALVDIADEGPGIATEHVPNIFSPFFTTREKGTGLGLAIAHHIVAAHEGSLDVHHTSSTGTCFRVRLPVRGRTDDIHPPSASAVAV